VLKISGAAASGKPVGVGAANPFPWIALLLGFASAFYVYPALEVIQYALTDRTLLNDRFEYTLRTLGNLLSSNALQQSLRVTLLYIVGSVAIQLLLGLIAALALHRGARHKLIGTAVVRSVVLTAWIMPGVVIGVIWRIILNEASYGMVNSILAGMGLHPVAFLSDRNASVWTLIIAGAWRGTAFAMILLYAGLQSISVVLYEAAEVDGGSSAQIFRHVTLPQLRPILAITLILATIGAMNTFDMVLALTAGGPGRSTEVLSLLTYNRLFTSFELAQASGLALIMLVLSLTFTLLYMRLLQRNDD
jgi:multiple sugar transport system permease protein